MGISVDAGLTSALYEELSRARGVPIEYELTEIILSDEALAGIHAQGLDASPRSRRRPCHARDLWHARGDA